MLALRVLGELEVVRHGRPLALPPSRKTRALLAYLALSGRRQSRERLCSLLWNVPDDPRGALRWSLSKLRKLVDDDDRERILADRDHVAFDAEGVDIDLLAARRLADGGLDRAALPALQAAADVFRGEVLEGLDLPDLHEFQAWLVAEREDGRKLLAAILRAVAERLAATPGAAIPYARRLVEADPYDASARALLLGLLDAAGHHDEAAQQRADARRTLGDEALPDVPPPDAALAPASPPATDAPVAAQDIRFCTTADGIRIAYATAGHGPPLVKTANWLNHLEYDWESPVWRHFTRSLCEDFTLVRYDERGNGLSDWNLEGLSFDKLVEDLETVVDRLGLERFPLLAISQGCAVAVAYTVRHPERVSHLVLHGGYVQGWNRRSPAEASRRKAMLSLMTNGWGQDNPAFRQLFTSLYIPDGSEEEMQWFNDLQRITTSPECAAQFSAMLGDIDVGDVVTRVAVPTLVTHSRNDAIVPFEQGRLLASLIPGARFVSLDSRNHLLLERDAAWSTFLAEVRRFVAGADR